MAILKRIKILTQSESLEFYGPPILTIEEQRFFFTLNDKELQESKKIRIYSVFNLL